MMADITKDTLISDLLRMSPDVRTYFMSIGMQCLHCSSARGETLEQACAVHGLDLDTLLDELTSIVELQD